MVGPLASVRTNTPSGERPVSIAERSWSPWRHDEDASRCGETSKAAGMRKKKDMRGFASMDPEMQKAISSRGGKAAHEQGTAHEFTAEEARTAGSKGGRARARKRHRTKPPDDGATASTAAEH